MDVDGETLVGIEPFMVQQLMPKSIKHQVVLMKAIKRVAVDGFQIPEPETSDEDLLVAAEEIETNQLLAAGTGPPACSEESNREIDDSTPISQTLPPDEETNGEIDSTPTPQALPPSEETNGEIDSTATPLTPPQGPIVLGPKPTADDDLVDYVYVFLHYNISSPDLNSFSSLPPFPVDLRIRMNTKTSPATTSPDQPTGERH